VVVDVVDIAVVVVVVVVVVVAVLDRFEVFEMIRICHRHSPIRCLHLDPHRLGFDFPPQHHFLLLQTILFARPNLQRIIFSACQNGLKGLVGTQRIRPPPPPLKTH